MHVKEIPNSGGRGGLEFWLLDQGSLHTPFFLSAPILLEMYDSYWLLGIN